MQEYIVSELKGEYPSKYPDSKKYVFKLEDYPAEVSCFSKFPIVQGQKLVGYVDTSKPPYHNFKFGSKAPEAPQSSEITARAINMMTFEVIPRLDRILAWQDRRDVLDGIEAPKKDPMAAYGGTGEVPEPNFDQSPF